YSLTIKPARATWRWKRRLHRLAGVTVLAGGLTGIAFLWAPQLPFGADAAPAGVQSYAVTSRLHVRTPVSYAQNPPVGGNHAALWQNCGFYSSPVANENAVHSLEHGAVWITYRPGLGGRQVDVLRG